MSNSSAARNSQIGSNEQNFRQVSAMLDQAVEDSVFPGCVVLVGQAGKVLYQHASGARYRQHEESENDTPPGLMSTDTVFDVASLTQALVTSVLVMELVDSGKLCLSDHVTRYVQGFGVYQKSGVTVRQLLSHSSGLPAWHAYYEELLRANTGARLGILNSRGAKDYVYNAITRGQLKYKPDSKQIYSDLGLIIVGRIIETLTGLSLAKAAQKFIFQPLGLKSSSYIDLSLIKQRGLAPVKELIAPTEDCPWRKRILCGEVHDENAWAMGGVAGNAGLFTSAEDVHAICSELLAAYHQQSNLVSSKVVRQFWAPVSELADLPSNSSWRLAWDSPSKENGLLNCGLSESAVGVNGLTGCSVWLEPQRGLDIILMSNRINPTRGNKKIQNFRAELIAKVLAAL